MTSTADRAELVTVVEDRLREVAKVRFAARCST